ncbi:MAG: AI-2E family transporter [Clostridia bacterium]|nr:AI-2E family transporter [Clostridia bacterium]
MKNGFKIEWKTCLKIGISIFVLYLCIYFFPSMFGVLKALLAAALPLLIGGVIAYIVNILMSFYERHYFPKTQKKFLLKTKRPFCLIGAYITLLAVIALIIVLIIPQLVSCVSVLVAKVPAAINNVITKLDEKGIITDELVNEFKSIDWKARIQQFAGVLTSGLGSAFDIVVSTVSSVVSGIVTAFLAIVFSFYVLASKDKLSSQSDRLCKRFLKENFYKKALYVIKTFNVCFHKYIVGQVTEAVILGVLCTLGMWILRLPYATMIGAFIAFTALVPVAGAYIGGAVGAFMIFTESPIKALIFLIFLVVLQQIEGNLIYPRVVGSSMGLPGIWVLAAITVGGGIMGVTGMLISVPIAATIYKFLSESVKSTPVRKKPILKEKSE